MVLYPRMLFKEATAREELYDPSLGSYMFYYNYQNKTFCIDATTDDSRFGRLVNHSKKLSNAKMKLFVIDSKPLLFLVATTNIFYGQEILYDRLMPTTVKIIKNARGTFST